MDRREFEETVIRDDQRQRDWDESRPPPREIPANVNPRPEILTLVQRLEHARNRVNSEPDVSWDTTNAMRDLVDAWNLVVALRGWPVIR